MQKYYSLNKYFRERFKCKVYKVSVDAGFSCPNRDGTLSTKGCIFCDNSAFSFFKREKGLPPLKEQIKIGMEFGRRKYKAQKFFVYFQSYTNTYAPVNILREKYQVIKEFEDVVGLSIGTRPDCIDKEKLDLINSFTSDYEVWIELGLQSIHDRTLKLINRNHTFYDFLKSVELIRRYKNIKICAHIILGLPQESKKDMLETAKKISELKLDGVKIHILHVIKGTELEKIYNRGEYTPLKLEEYVDIVCDFLEILPPKLVIQRLTADCSPDKLVAPVWILNKNKVLKEIDSELERRNSFQGKLYGK